MEVRCAGLAGIAARDQDGAGFDPSASGDVKVAAVAVGPAGAVGVVDDGDADAAGRAAASAPFGAALLPPRVWPG